MKGIFGNDKNGFGYQRVGTLMSHSYEEAIVFTSDWLREKAGGLPKGALLLAVGERLESGLCGLQGEALILRVGGTAQLPSDGKLNEIRHSRFRRMTDPDEAIEYDPLTAVEVQEGAVSCLVVGTAYVGDQGLVLAHDLETVTSAGGLGVYLPTDKSLEELVNHRNPDQLERINQQSLVLGAPEGLTATTIGAVQWSSARRRRQSQVIGADVLLYAQDLLSKRTAITGMSTYGKSNTVKLLVEATEELSSVSSKPIGQLIFDRRGEYANANHRSVAITERFPETTKRYSFADKPGFKSLKPNFYNQPAEGLAVIKEHMRDDPRSHAVDALEFVDWELEEPGPDADYATHKRYHVQKSAFQVLLYVAGYPADPKFKVYFEANAKIRALVDQENGSPFANPASGLSLPDARAWFTAARSSNRLNKLQSKSGADWVDANLNMLLNMIVGKNKDEGSFNGAKAVAGAINSHSTTRSEELLGEIYKDLVIGGTTILDISEDRHGLSQKLGERIARMLIDENDKIFRRGETPPFIQVIVEEGHHLIPQNSKLTEPWPVLAKEGSKFNIGFVFATQEPSSMHHNILANTENWVMHCLNSKEEVKALADFHDFEYCAHSMRTTEEVGLAWIRTSSNPFTTPVKVKKFGPLLPN